MLKWITTGLLAAVLAGCGATSGSVPAPRATAAAHPALPVMIGTGY